MKKYAVFLFKKMTKLIRDINKAIVDIHPLFGGYNADCCFETRYCNTRKKNFVFNNGERKNSTKDYRIVRSIPLCTFYKLICWIL